MTNEEIKALAPATCPHCGKQIIVEFVTEAPKLTNILTVDGIEVAKQECINRIEALGVDKSITQQIIDWLRNPETLFCPDDIDEVIEQIKQQNDSLKNSATQQLFES